LNFLPPEPGQLALHVDSKLFM
jgi:hypothetical protein